MRDFITRNKASLATSTGLALVALPTTGALAAAGDPEYSLAPATDSIVGQVTAVLTDVLPIAGGLLALTIGWKLLKKMTKSA